MNKKIKFFIWIVVFAGILFGSYIAYNKLSQSAEQANETPAVSTSPKVSTTPEAVLPQNTEPSPQNTEPATQSDKKPAPDFAMINHEGSLVNLYDFKGKPIVLNFWASWCPPCKSEMPDFNKVYEDLKGDVQFLMVDLVDGQRETVEKGKKYVNDQGFSFPVFFDTEQIGAYVYGITSIPSTIIIDKEGNISDKFIGAINEQKLRTAIEKTTE